MFVKEHAYAHKLIDNDFQWKKLPDHVIAVGGLLKWQLAKANCSTDKIFIVRQPPSSQQYDIMKTHVILT